MLTNFTENYVTKSMCKLYKRINMKTKLLKHLHYEEISLITIELLRAHQNNMFSITLGITSQMDFIQAKFLIHLRFRALDLQNAVYPKEK